MFDKSDILPRFRITQSVHGPGARAAMFWAALAFSPTASAELVRTVAADTGLISWTWSDLGATVQLIQRRPNQTRAFFIARGFTTAQTDIIAHACVFQSIFRNDGQSRVDFDLSDWRVEFGGKAQPPVMREDWEERWREQDIADGPRIALKWALVPTRQYFEAGDYNWGMISFGPPPGTRFKLGLRLRRDGEAVQVAIPELTCATQPPE